MTNTTIGGNWKEFWLAASQGGGGDLALVEFHLKNGVDPNFQHPEMESTALCEAVRAGNAKVVEYLLKYKDKRGNVAVDPTISSAYENQTPLEIAMELRHHDIVDMILDALPPGNYAEESKHCKQVLVSVPDANICSDKSQYARAVVSQVLELGHRVVVHSPSNDAIRGDDNGLPPPAVCEKEANNGKRWSVSSIEEIPSLIARGRNPRITPSDINVWFYFLSAEGMEPKNSNFLNLGTPELVQSSSFFSNVNKAPGQVWVMVPSTHLAAASDKQQLIRFLQHCRSKHGLQANAMVVPCSWWDQFWRGGSSPWIETESLRRLLKASEGEVGMDGKIYNHKLEQMPWAKTSPNTVLGGEQAIS